MCEKPPLPRIVCRRSAVLNTNHTHNRFGGEEQLSVVQCGKEQIEGSRRRDFSFYHGVKVRSPRDAGSLLLFVPKRLHLDLPCSKAFQADGGL